MILVFLLYKPRHKAQSYGPSWWDYFCIVLASLSCIYLIVNYDFVMNSSANSTPTQVTLGWVTIVLLLEAARRVMGMVFPLLAVIAILYGLFGNYFPGIWYHRGIDYQFMIEHLYLGTQGIWGITTAVTATTVAIYIISGVILMREGTSDFMMRLSLLIAGRTTVRPDNVVELASSFFTMLSGSPAANFAVTGNITIAMMKRLVIDKDFAGAVEARVSSRGELAPIVLGAGAVLLAEFVWMPCTQVVDAAVVS